MILDREHIHSRKLVLPQWADITNKDNMQKDSWIDDNYHEHGL